MAMEVAMAARVEVKLKVLTMCPAEVTDWAWTTCR